MQPPQLRTGKLPYIKFIVFGLDTLYSLFFSLFLSLFSVLEKLSQVAETLIILNAKLDIAVAGYSQQTLFFSLPLFLMDP